MGVLVWVGGGETCGWRDRKTGMVWVGVTIVKLQVIECMNMKPNRTSWDMASSVSKSYM
jgi:hypothetical protein